MPNLPEIRWWNYKSNERGPVSMEEAMKDLINEKKRGRKDL